jgi:uncharacterized protein YqhQ
LKKIGTDMVWQAMYSHWKIRLRSFGRLLALPALLMARPAHEGGEESDVAGSLSSEGKARTTGEKETQILLGGQAVIEGVLMRSPRAYCVAVRTPSRGIIEDRGILPSPGDRWRVWRWPFFRGLGVLGQTLSLGIRALRFSADAALEEEAKEEAKAKGEDSSHVKAEFPAWMMWAQVAFSIAFFIVLYKFIPLVIATQVENFGLSGGWLGFNLIDGIVRLAIFLGFLALISLWGDIRRTFEYHGGEHMVVYTWEAQKPVTVENARQFPPEHPRCGTSFLMVVILTSLLLYALIPVEGFLLRLAVRLALLPVIVATSYEVIRAAGRNQSSAFWSAAVWPGIMLQRLITTKQPDDGQIEVAIQALEGALEVERSTSTSTGQPAPAGVN